jgi:hypothetical protein
MAARTLPFCPRCGKENNIGQAYCQSCGTNIDEGYPLRSTYRRYYSAAQAPYDIRGGHYRTLVGLLAVGVFSTIVWIIAPVFGFLMGAFISLASTEIIYEDAKAVNRVRKGEPVDPLGWAVFAFFLWIVALPWYLFRSRRSALGMNPSLPSR